jgi:hypothetical protein
MNKSDKKVNEKTQPKVNPPKVAAKTAPKPPVKEAAVKKKAK